MRQVAAAGGGKARRKPPGAERSEESTTQADPLERLENEGGPPPLSPEQDPRLHPDEREDDKRTEDKN